MAAAAAKSASLSARCSWAARSHAARMRCRWESINLHTSRHQRIYTIRMLTLVPVIAVYGPNSSPAPHSNCEVLWCP